MSPPDAEGSIADLRQALPCPRIDQDHQQGLPEIGIADGAIRQGDNLRVWGMLHHADACCHQYSDGAVSHCWVLPQNDQRKIESTLENGTENCPDFRGSMVLVPRHQGVGDADPGRSGATDAGVLDAGFHVDAPASGNPRQIAYRAIFPAIPMHWSGAARPWLDAILCPQMIRLVGQNPHPDLGSCARWPRHVLECDAACRQ